jgi:hypothetical protein
MGAQMVILSKTLVSKTSLSKTFVAAGLLTLVAILSIMSLAPAVLQ